MNIRLKAKTTRITEYLIVIAVSAFVVTLRLLLHPWLQADAPLYILMLAPIISALYGARPALLSTLLCLIAGWFLFMQPYNSFQLYSGIDVVKLSFFAIAGCGIGLLGGQRREVLSALDASRQRQELAVNAADLGVFAWDLVEGKAFWENARMYEIFGYAPVEPTPDYDAFYATCLHKDDIASVRASLQRALRPDKNFHAVCRIIRKADKEVRLVELSGRFLFAADKTPRTLLGVARDITEQKTLQDNAVSTHMRLHTLLDNAPVYIYQIDSRGNYEFVNRAYAELVGSNADELVGQPLTKVFKPEDARTFIEHNELVLKSRQTKEFEEHVLFGGRHYVYSSIKTPLFDNKGNALSVLGISTDITERKQIEHELRESDRRKDEFLAVLGHELRNPLAPLRAGVELLEHEAGNPVRIEGIRTMMHRQVSHLVRLVDDLLNMSRISRGLVELQSSHIDLNVVVQAALEQVRPLMGTRNHELVLETEERPLAVFGDFERLTQVIVNLLTNAAKFTAPGGRIFVRTCADAGSAVFAVNDNGYGIPPTHLDAIFDMFIQVQDHKVHTGGEGLGIGLALCRQFVDQHKGTITAQSRGAGHGSEFTVRIPLHNAVPEVQPETDVPADNVEKRILVVDDNEDAALTLCALLRLKGHVAKAVHDGPSALACLTDFAPQVILLDIGMPGMNGYEVAEMVRSMPGGEDIHLIALTGWGQKADKLNALKAGFDNHLTKPVDTSLLWKLIGYDKYSDHRSESIGFIQ